jgi:hypothetical protein
VTGYEFRVSTTYAPSSTRNYDFREDAICYEYGSWYEWDRLGEGHASADDKAIARRVCARCPVRDACLADAKEGRDIDTFRAGLTGAERAELWQLERLQVACIRGHAKSELVVTAAKRRCKACEREDYHRKRNAS